MSEETSNPQPSLPERKEGDQRTLLERLHDQAIIEEIKVRAGQVSAKVRERFIEVFLPQIENAAQAGQLSWKLRSLDDSFGDLFEGRTPKAFAEAYAGWSAAEKAALFQVIFGKEAKVTV